MTAAQSALLFVFALNVAAFCIIAYRCRNLPDEPDTHDASPLEQLLACEPGLFDNPDHSFEASHNASLDVPGEWPPWGMASDADKWARVAEMIRTQPAVLVQPCPFCGRLMPITLDKSLACDGCCVWRA